MSRRLSSKSTLARLGNAFSRSHRRRIFFAAELELTTSACVLGASPSEAGAPCATSLKVTCDRAPLDAGNTKASATAQMLKRKLTVCRVGRLRRFARRGRITQQPRGEARA